MADDLSVACLIRIKSGTKTRAHVILRPRFVIGRSADVDVPIISTTISRRHLQVDVTKDGVSITDLGSNNGTFIDDVRITPQKPVLVRPDDKIRLGANADEFRFLDIPVPMELQSTEQQKGTMLSGMTELQKEIDEIGKKSIEEEKVRARASMKLEEEQMKLRVERELVAKKSLAESEAKQIIDQAQSKADRLLEKSRQSVESYQAGAIDAHLSKKKELEDEISKLELDAKEIAAKLREAAELKAEELLKLAEENAKKAFEAATRKGDELIGETHEKIAERIKNAEAEARLIVEHSKSDAENIVKDARAQAETLISENKSKARAIIEQAKQRAETEAQEEKRQALDSIRAATLEEQERVINEYRGTIDKVKASVGSLQAESRKVKSELESFLTEKQTLEEEMKILKKHAVEERRALNEIQDNLKWAKETIKKSEVALVDMKTAKEKKQEMEAQFEKFKSDYNHGMKQIEDDLKAKTQASLLEFEKSKRLQEEDLARSKLEAIDRLKSTIKEEEKKYLNTLEMRAVEISRSIETKLLPRIESDLKAKGVSASLGSFLNLVKSAVDEVILQERPSIKAVTEHLGIDPEKEKARQERSGKLVWGVSVAAVLALLVFGKDLYQALKTAAANSSYTDSIVAKRNAESIYTPIQYDDWKETYTGNILFLRYYYEAKTDPAYEKQWALKLNNLELLRSLNLNEDEMVRFIGKEGALVQQLWNQRQAIDAHYLDEGMETMNKTELAASEEMVMLLKSEENLASIRKIEKDFTLQFIKKQFGASGKVRAPTTID
jgi:pSer/pThr/pTyr-binding forkhead associated (FHA) protein